MALNNMLPMAGLLLFFFALNFLIINGASLRRREGSAENQISSTKKMVRLIALLLSEMFVLTLAWFSLAYVVSLNITLPFEGDANAMSEYWDRITPDDGVPLDAFVSWQGSTISIYPFFYAFSKFDAPVQTVLYDVEWELQDEYNYFDKPEAKVKYESSSEPKELQPEELLSAAQNKKEKELQTSTVQTPKTLIRFLSLFDKNFNRLEPFRIQVLPLREHLNKLFSEQWHEYCVRVILVNHDGGETNRYRPSAFGEKQIAELDEALYDCESDVYYLYSRSCFSRFSAACNGLEFGRNFMFGMVGFIILLAISILAQNTFSSSQDRKRILKQLEHIRNYTHDMKTPLAILWQYSDQVEPENFPPAERELMGKIKFGVQDMARRVQGILEYMRQGVGTLRLDLFSLNDLAEDCLLEVSPLLEDKGAKWELGEGADMQVEADKNRMEQTIRNFLSNAVKHTPKGGTVNVRVSQEKKKRVRVTVFNSGEGIPKEEQKKIWEMFYSLEGGGDNALRGTGIGLAVVRDTAARHRGSSDCRNVDGGVEFWIEIPRRQSSIRKSSR